MSLRSDQRVVSLRVLLMSFGARLRAVVIDRRSYIHLTQSGAGLSCQSQCPRPLFSSITDEKV